MPCLLLLGRHLAGQLDEEGHQGRRQKREEVGLHRWVEGVGRWSDVIGGSFGLCADLWWEGRRREGRNHSRWIDDVRSVCKCYDSCGPWGHS